MVGVALFGSLIASHGQFWSGLHIALAVSIAALLASASLTRMLAV
jgi:hypothetical protein